ncbi:MAG TPA: Hsp20/alpha crystallin family protein [Geopsychrobacteraceae bacterium]|nr:Hsp20/alpha crystallin family protein [Geopsychrobacteraceae bacterium]
MARMDLFREMENLQREIDHTFGHFGVGRRLSPSFLPGIGTGDYPRINLSEDEESFYLEAMSPGINPKELSLNVMQHTLNLSGERKQEKESKCTWHRNERGSGKFMRTIEFPTAINIEKADAEYHNGMLLITLPKAESVKPKRIEIRPH